MYSYMGVPMVLILVQCDVMGVNGGYNESNLYYLRVPGIRILVRVYYY